MAEQEQAYYTVKQFSERNPAFTEGSLRWQIFNEDLNGLKKSGAISRLGRKILIKEPEFFAWIESQNQSGAKVAA